MCSVQINSVEFWEFEFDLKLARVSSEHKKQHNKQYTVRILYNSRTRQQQHSATSKSMRYE